MKRRFHYCWIVCIGAMIVNFSAALIVNGFSVYLPYIVGQNGFNNTQISVVITIRTLSQLVSMALIDKYYRKLSLRTGLFLSVFGIAIGFACFGLAGSFPLYCIAAAIGGVCMGVGGPVGSSMIINGWFQSGKGLALGLTAAGTGVATIVAPLILRPLIDAVSLRGAFLIEAAFVVLCAVLVLVLVRSKPEEKGLARYQTDDEPETAAVVSGKSLSRGQHATLLVGVFMIGSISFGVASYYSLLYSEKGFDGTQIALLLSIQGIALLIAKIIAGRVIDKIGAVKTNLILFAFAVVSILLMCFGSGHPIAVVASILMGLGMPISTVAVPVYASDFSTQDTYVVLLKRLNLAQALAGLLISAVGGTLADLVGYVPIFIGMAVLLIVSAILIQSVYLRTRKQV